MIRRSRFNSRVICLRGVVCSMGMPVVRLACIVLNRGALHADIVLGVVGWSY